MNRNVRFEDEQMELAAGALFDKLGFSPAKGAAAAVERVETIANLVAWVGTNLRTASTAIAGNVIEDFTRIKAMLKGTALNGDDFETYLRGHVRLASRLLSRFHSKGGWTNADENEFARISIDLENLPYVAMYAVKGEAATRKALVERHDAFVDEVAKRTAENFIASVNAELALGATGEAAPPQAECDAYIDALCDLFESAVAYKAERAKHDMPSGAGVRRARKTADTVEPINERVRVMADEIKYSNTGRVALRRIADYLKEAAVPPAGIGLWNMMKIGYMLVVCITVLVAFVSLAYAPARYANVNTDEMGVSFAHLGMITARVQEVINLNEFESRVILSVAESSLLGKMEQREYDVQNIELAKDHLRLMLEGFEKARSLSDTAPKHSLQEELVKNLLDDNYAIPRAIERIMRESIEAGDTPEQAAAFTPSADEIAHARMDDIRAVLLAQVVSAQSFIKNAQLSMKLNRYIMGYVKSYNEAIEARRNNAVGILLRTAGRSAGSYCMLPVSAVQMTLSLGAPAVSDALTVVKDEPVFSPLNAYLSAVAAFTGWGGLLLVVGKTLEKLIPQVVAGNVRNPFSLLPEAMRPSAGTMKGVFLTTISMMNTLSVYRAVMPMLMYGGRNSIVAGTVGSLAIAVFPAFKIIEALFFDRVGAYYMGFGNVVRRSAIGFAGGTALVALIYWSITWGMFGDLTEEVDIATNHPATFLLKQRLAADDFDFLLDTLDRHVGHINQNTIGAPPLKLMDVKLAKFLIDNGTNPFGN